ncbi:glycosyl hydrolases family 43 domain-containing protein [Sarocladium implicatum]|nr:glycosyl hydrolases family 43 domain-containing protein [Sarocladium implicatum]
MLLQYLGVKALAALTLSLGSLPSLAGAAVAPRPHQSRQAGSGQFRNPLNQGADPTLVYFNGNYFLSRTQGDRLSLWKAPSLAGLLIAEPITIWQDTNTERDTEIWAPGLAQFDNKWYIYYTAASSAVPDSERDSTHRLYVLESEGNDPTGPWHFKAKIADQGHYAIDGEPFTHNGQRYFTWTAPGRGFAGGPQQIFLQKLENPWTTEGPVVELPVDQGGCPEVREGPTPLYSSDRTFLTYSSCDTGKPDYSIYGIYIDKSADPMDPQSWEVIDGALFERNDAVGVYGTGHHFFFKSPDGTEDWIAYHAKNTATPTYSFRSTRAQKIRWTSNGLPDLGRPLAPGATQQLPSGDPGPGSRGINDRDSEVSYSGAWQQGSCATSCFWGDDTYSDSAGATAVVTFTGSQIAIFASVAPDHGYATLSIDGGTETRINYYNELRIGEHNLWTSEKLTSGQHTLRIRVTGEKPSAATAAYITVDRFEVFP